MPEGLQAGGNVKPKRIVKMNSAAGDNRVVQAAAATAPVWGISGQGTRYAQIDGLTLNDGYTAIAGENCKVFGVGEVAPLQLGGTVVAGDPITSDSDGQGVTSTTAGDYLVGDAMQGGTTGQAIEVRVLPREHVA